jgi:hypothetical protein
MPEVLATNRAMRGEGEALGKLETLWVNFPSLSPQMLSLAAWWLKKIRDIIQPIGNKEYLGK